MAQWFDFAGVRSTALGVYALEYPPIAYAEERVEFKQVPGRSGHLTLLEGDGVYEDVLIPIKCVLRAPSGIDQVAAWLRGRGALVLGNAPNRYYVARCVNQVDLTKIIWASDHRTFAAVFRCQPYRYVYPVPGVITRTTSGQALPSNLGNVDAEPLIVVTGSGDITLTIGDKTLQISGLSSAITIDVAAGLAYAGSVNLTASLTGDWPLTIPPGAHVLSWTGTVTKVEITPNWRYR